ncbi:hypothetical protein Dimus_039762 [Dionaea muscipula]
MERLYPYELRLDNHKKAHITGSTHTASSSLLGHKSTRNSRTPPKNHGLGRFTQEEYHLAGQEHQDHQRISTKRPEQHQPRITGQQGGRGPRIRGRVEDRLGIWEISGRKKTRENFYLSQRDSLSFFFSLSRHREEEGISIELMEQLAA